MIALNMVTFQEERRYLDACLTWVRELDIVDEIFVLDDRSTDATVEIALHHGAKVYVREEEEPSFMESENLFRQLGWERMVDRLDPDETDWIIGLDADEFLMSVPDLPASGAIEAQIHEVFLMQPISVRVDGYWGSITGRRMMRYQEGDQRFRTGMGCGVFPMYANFHLPDAPKMQILHFGYATNSDRQEKYNRYTGVSNNHANSHIQSILRPPHLMLWESAAPTVWRGYA